MNKDLLSADRITRWLKESNAIWFTFYAALSAFCLYTSVYAFRKTFAAATFDKIAFIGISYKVWLVIFQTLGYGLSKFIGIRIISELKSASRANGILLMVTIAGISWLLFAVTPAPYNIVFLFTNGLPLGMVWGMVFAYLEGRRMTEVLGAALSVSFIFSAGLCRSAGAYVMQAWNVSQWWMPFTVCCLFLIPLLVFLWLLDKVPPPTSQDESLRTRREPMDKKVRRHFTLTFLPGIIMFVIAYVLLTTFRDFRDNFSAEIWNTLGKGNSPEIFTKTEVPVSLAVLLVMGSIMLIRNNILALMVNHLIVAFGMVLIGVSTFLFETKVMNAEWWMIFTGLGLYLGYVPFNCIFFDRLIAAFRYVGTVGFIMYVADSFGYLGSIAVLFVKEFSYAQTGWLQFIIWAGYIISFAGTILILGSMTYFYYKHKSWQGASFRVKTSEPKTITAAP
jgi:MFS family permease